MDANKQLKDHGPLTTTSCKHPARSDMLANNEMIVISKDATAENPKIEEDSESEDDLLANFIEYSSDEDEEVIKDNRKSHYLVATKSLSFVPSLPSAHQNPSKSLVDNILKVSFLAFLTIFSLKQVGRFRWLLFSGVTVLTKMETCADKLNAVV